MDGVFHINPADPTPLYAQLERAIRFAIATERLRVGEQLPTVRQLAVDLRINANTVAKVYTELERAGLVETRRGVGTFVRARHYEVGGARRSDRERELRELADRFLAEASVLGFSPAEVLEHLARRRKKERINA
jgi:GntR family transcriptional regulator